MSDVSPIAGRKPMFSEGYKNVVLSLLMLAYTLNFIDRTIIGTIGQAIKVDLKLTDTQLGLLGGFAFAILYTFLGIPLARVAERWKRVWIISLALLVWSGFTALCGVAMSFGQLLAFRVGVGVGEAGLSPPAHSLISDYFEPKKRSSALGVFSFGIPLGTMVGAALGGWLAQTYGWRVAFVTVGAPGILMALAIWLVIKEPPRGQSEQAGGGAPLAVQPFSIGYELSELGAVAKSLFLKWPVLNMVLGITLTSFAGYGAGQFVPPYFIRTFGLGYATVGLTIGLVGGFSSGIGTLLGGFTTDWASRRSGRWYALVPAIGVAAGAPIYMLAYSYPDWKVAALILLVPGIFGYTYLGPTFAVIQNVVEPRRRATATALLFFVLNLIGLGVGPPFVGWLIDHFAQFHFANPGSYGFFDTIAHSFGAAANGAAKFVASCPGGAAPKGAPAALASACKAALLSATHEGVIAGVCFSLWGAFHFFLASFGMAKELKRVASLRPGGSVA
jgi:MFS family permease